MSTTFLQSQEHSHTHNGKQVTIIMHLFVTPNKKRTCCSGFVARLTIREPEKTPSQRLGELHSCTITKSSKTDDWKQQMLAIPANYGGDIRAHASEIDSIQDREKVMLLLYDESGLPKSSFTAEQQDYLKADKLHFIDKFWLEKQYIGTGLGRLVLQSYLDGLTQLEKGHAFIGPVVLSPAPMEVTDGQYDEGMKKLINAYGKSGFEVWLEPDFTLRGPIAIMGRWNG